MSEMSIQEACDLTDQFGKFLKGMARLQEAAKTMRGAEPVIAQRLAQSEALQADLAAAATRLDSLRAECDVAVTSAAAILSNARIEAAGFVQAAKAEASTIIAAARKQERAALKRAEEASSAAAASEARASEAANELTATTERIARVKAEALKSLA